MLEVAGLPMAMLQAAAVSQGEALSLWLAKLVGRRDERAKTPRFVAVGDGSLIVVMWGLRMLRMLGSSRCCC
ncbi:hypothetical protein ENSA5_57180 [Enhygromyxa salina]|uniref:Uncharacterized protein n=1 Tax=Enhygromyxa salina TaxID=215803 RepID=A0A2S9XEG3_9BACT|nr:hypothetical protein ENSA5_57180 [Enhygromyxa salina]